MINLWFFLRLFQERCQLIWAGFFANVEIDRLQSLLWRSKKKCSVATGIKALTPAMMQLYPVQIW